MPDRVARAWPAGAVAWLLAAGLAACGGGDRVRLPSDSASNALATPTPNVLVRVAVPGDSSARALADSLRRDGWPASVTEPQPPGDQRTVDVAVPGNAVLARLIAHALQREGVAATVTVAGTRPSGAVRISAMPVNHGTHGMSARVRWTASADRHALLVVEDARAVENDPLPNGFVIAVEGAPPLQRDSVWDVVPTPDWHRVAYARAYTSAPGESDSVPASEWHRLASQVGLMESDVRRNAFPTSGMVTAVGVARPFIIDSLGGAGADASRERALPIAEGWRLGWSRDGTRLAIGAPPELISDDGVAARWRVVDPVTGSPRGGIDAALVERPQWTEGPTLDISTPIDMQERRAFRTGGADVESEDGWIRVFERGPTRLRAPRIVGPGVALTTSANGEFIVAIVPDPDARPYDPPNQLVVYHIIRR